MSVSGAARIRGVGVSAYLVEVAAGDPVHALHRYLVAGQRDGSLPGVLDVVPGARTVLVDARPGGLTAATLRQYLTRWTGAGTADGPSPSTVEIPVHYDGPDLAGVAELAGMTPAEVVARHSAAPMTVAFCGFAPGFAYIGDLPEPLRLPRLPVPRTAVPAGAVAIAEEYTGIYPRQSPGGWRILGRTSADLWNLDRDPPALLSPGTRVQFRPAP
jgi:KipI family sensor histidine kinase inhibitor